MSKYPIVLVISVVSSPVGVTEIIHSILHIKCVVINTLDKPHPQNLIHFSSLRGVPGVAKSTQIKTVWSLRVHVAPVCRPGLAVDAVITRVWAGLSEEGGKGVDGGAQDCGDPSGSGLLLLLQHLLPSPTGVTEIVFHEITMRTVGRYSHCH